LAKEANLENINNYISAAFGNKPPSKNTKSYASNKEKMKEIEESRLASVNKYSVSMSVNDFMNDPDNFKEICKSITGRTGKTEFSGKDIFNEASRMIKSDQFKIETPRINK